MMGGGGIILCKLPYLLFPRFHKQIHISHPGRQLPASTSLLTQHLLWTGELTNPLTTTILMFIFQQIPGTSWLWSSLCRIFHLQLNIVNIFAFLMVILQVQIKSTAYMGIGEPLQHKYQNQKPSFNKNMETLAAQSQELNRILLVSVPCQFFELYTCGPKG